MKRSELFFGFLRLPLDFLTTFSAFLLAYRLRQMSDFIPFVQLPLNLDTFPAWHEYKIIATISSAAFLIFLALNGAYSFRTNRRFSREITKVLSASIIWLMAIISYYFIIRDFPFSRLALFYSWLIALILVLFGRLLIKIIEKILHKWNIGKTRVLIIGNNEIARIIFENLKKSPNYKIVGALIDEKAFEQKNPGTTIATNKTFQINNEKNERKWPKILGKISEILEITKKFHIDEIIQTTSNLSGTRSLDILNFCRTHHIQYNFVPDLVEVHQTNIEIKTLSGLPIIELRPTALEGWGKIWKRIFDLVAGIIGLIILSPLLLIIAILIKLDSRGPVFFSRLDNGEKVMRIGQGGKPFHFIKFRSMKPNSDSMRYSELADRNMRGDGPLVKIKNDPRITRFGRFLRKTSLDELPQLWSVIKGDMSLVGPRPHLPEEVAKYTDSQKFVLTIKPGITGLAQISGRSDLSFDEEVRLDTYYIEKWSLWLDLKILFKTFFALVKKYEE